MTHALEPGVLQPVAPGVRRLLAPNPGMMTGPGTNTYLLGTREVVVLDPGPDIAAHVDAILDAVGDRLRLILVTHTHPDHSPAARRLAAATGAQRLGRRAPGGRHQDRRFRPDRELRDGEDIVAGDVTLRALHTPGHASNHLCYLRPADRLLFTGDHIINGSTVVIDPPDGDMRAYLHALERLLTESPAAILPGHGELIDEPQQAIEHLIAHRLEREARVVDALGAHPHSTTAELVAVVYAEVDAALHPVAQRSLLAHLEKLRREGRAAECAGRWRSAAVGG